MILIRNKMIKLLVLLTALSFVVKINGKAGDKCTTDADCGDEWHSCKYMDKMAKTYKRNLQSTLLDGTERDFGSLKRNQENEPKSGKI